MKAGSTYYMARPAQEIPLSQRLKATLGLVWKFSLGRPSRWMPCVDFVLKVWLSVLAEEHWPPNLVGFLFPGLDAETQADEVLAQLGEDCVAD